MKRCLYPCLTSQTVKKIIKLDIGIFVQRALSDEGVTNQAVPGGHYCCCSVRKAAQVSLNELGCRH